MGSFCTTSRCTHISLPPTSRRHPPLAAGSEPRPPLGGEIAARARRELERQTGPAPNIGERRKPRRPETSDIPSVGPEFRQMAHCLDVSEPLRSRRCRSRRCRSRRCRSRRCRLRFRPERPVPRRLPFRHHLFRSHRRVPSLVRPMPFTRRAPRRVSRNRVPSR